MHLRKKMAVMFLLFALDIGLAAGVVAGYYFIGIRGAQKTLDPNQMITIPKPGETTETQEPGTAGNPAEMTTGAPEVTVLSTEEMTGETERETFAETTEEMTEETTEETTEYRKNIEYLTWTEKFLDKFTEEPVQEANHYSDEHVNITIETKEIGEGDNKITYYVADIYVAAIEYFHAAMPNDDRTLCSYNTAGGMFGINPSFALVTNGDYASSSPRGLIVRNGQILRAEPDSSELCVLRYDGTMEVFDPDTYNMDKAIEEGVWQTWEFGPSLLRKDGSPKTEDSEYYLTYVSKWNNLGYLSEAHPRTAIGYYEPGHYCLMVADGRAPGHSRGMTFPEMSQAFAELGCSCAYNLDGGNSSHMAFFGNYCDRQIEREVTDFIVVDTNPVR